MSKPSRSEWDQLRPEVTRLYRADRLSLHDIVCHLRRGGYRVSERALKDRLRAWTVRKNFREDELLTALWLWIQDQHREPLNAGCFRISGQVVPVHRVLQHFRKKGISDPFRWFKAIIQPDFAPDPAVELVRGKSPGCKTSELWLPTPPAAADGTSDTSGVSSYCLGRLIRPAPGLELPDCQVLHATHEYCHRYLVSGKEHEHLEPLVHRDTTHGRFGDLMQTGLFHLSRHQLQQGFVSIRAAFLLIPDLIRDRHPMALTLYLSVLCELLAHCRHSGDEVFKCLVNYVLGHAVDCSQIQEEAQPLHAVLKAIFVSQDRLHTALLSSELVMHAFTESRSGDWKTLYVHERHCDNLYHAGLNHKGSRHRRDLLVAQESFYAPHARNVLWTMTNVADDCLTMNDFDQAKAYFALALDRADMLSGFYRAKIRFAALEGLARVELKQAQARAYFSRGPDSRPDDLTRQTQIAHLLLAAQNEATAWFEPTSRRLRRVQMQIQTLGIQESQNT